jgi:hypothetical protein
MSRVKTGAPSLRLAFLVMAGIASIVSLSTSAEARDRRPHRPHRAHPVPARAAAAPVAPVPSSPPPPAGFTFTRVGSGASAITVPLSANWCLVDGRAHQKALEIGIFPAPVAPVVPDSVHWLIPCHEKAEWSSRVANERHGAGGSFELSQPTEFLMIGKLRNGLTSNSTWLNGTPVSATVGDQGLAERLETIGAPFQNNESRSVTWRGNGTEINVGLSPRRDSGGFISGQMTAGAAVNIRNIGRGSTSTSARAVIVYHGSMPGTSQGGVFMRSLACQAGALAYANGGAMAENACSRIGG